MLNLESLTIDTEFVPDVEQYQATVEGYPYAIAWSDSKYLAMINCLEILQQAHEGDEDKLKS